MWEGKWNAWESFSSPRKPISKDVFVNLLCKIWNEAISFIRFEVTGIYLINKSNYPEKRLKPKLEHGRKEKMVDILGKKTSNAITTTQSSPFTPLKRRTSSLKNSPSKSPKSPGNQCSCKVCKQLGPKPVQAPKEKMLQTNMGNVKILKTANCIINYFIRIFNYS